jgi:hypothetical protein
LVLTAQRVTQGTGNVWGSAVNSDSATRRIVAANDSIAKQAVLIEAQARRAALDSVRRATIDSVRRSLGAAIAPETSDSAAARSAPGTVKPPVQRRDTTRARRDTVRPDTIRKNPT